MSVRAPILKRETEILMRFTLKYFYDILLEDKRPKKNMGALLEHLGSLFVMGLGYFFIIMAIISISTTVFEIILINTNAVFKLNAKTPTPSIPKQIGLTFLYAIELSVGNWFLIQGQNLIS